VTFESFPATWQNDYKKNHRNFDSNTITDITGHMNLIKGIGDNEEKQ